MTSPPEPRLSVRGINVLRNDGRAALAVAHAAQADFIRVNVLAGVRVTDQGIVEGIAHELLRDRSLLDFKVDGLVRNPVDADRVRALMKKIR